MRQKVARLIVRYLVHWYVVTAILYFAAIPFTVLVFPATTLVLTVVVLFSGFTAAVASLASVLVDTEKETAQKEAQDDEDAESGLDEV